MPTDLSAAAFRLMLRGFLVPQAKGSPLSRAVRGAAFKPLTAGEKRYEAAIDAIRAEFASSTESVHVVDFGAGTSGGARPPERRVSEIYGRAASGPLWGRFLGALVRELKPAMVLELGTNLGVSAYHLAGALGPREQPDSEKGGKLVSLEGAPALAELATKRLTDLGHPVGPGQRVEIVVGAFAETLPDVCTSHDPFDLVFVDGHHEEQATLDYVRLIQPHVSPGAVIVLDDVEPGRPVWRAWRTLTRGLPSGDRVYLGRYGLFTFPGPHETQVSRERLDTQDQEPAPLSY